MINQIFYAWDVSDKVNFCYNLNLALHHKISFQKVVFDTLTNQVVKNYVRNTLNIR